jgi:hypothetical protein|uniref:Uncharacterized protein n=1 Tax=Picea glauca TaxID=3330 RepID=A0A117NGH7_PICGL|nr:hypothetical protein ABT39_MTgene6278 [Picea glauca]QHR87909.1 hypothetical protein Q903MT_gene1921 [Picea sitchensis]
MYQKSEHLDRLSIIVPKPETGRDTGPYLLFVQVIVNLLTLVWKLGLDKLLELLLDLEL